MVWLIIMLASTNSYDLCLEHIYISDGNKQKLISAKILYIITLLDFGLSEGQICDWTGFSGAVISCVHSQHHCNLLKPSGDDSSKLTMAKY